VWRNVVGLEPVDYPGVDLRLSPNEQAFRDELRLWIENNHPGAEPEADEDAFEFRRSWQRQLADAGWAGISWPEEYGGRGATLVEQAIFNEEMVRYKAPAMANPLGLLMGGPVVIAHGTEEQKQRFLAPILTAEEIWCQGFSEPESGSDLASLKSRAVRENGEWVVTGQKVWTTLAHRAKWCMLLARTDQEAPKHKGLTYFLLDMEQPGVSVRPLVQITGEPEFNELFIDKARIPDENVIGEVGQGWQVGLTTLLHERAGLAFGLQVQLKQSLGELIELCHEYELSDDPIMRQRIAQLYIESEVLRLNAYRGLTKQMKTGTPGPEGSLPKWHWSEINQSLSEAATEIRGEDAPLMDSRWTYRFLRSRANSVEGGTTEVLKNIVAERVLGLPRLR
jgi:alkylation response protein AidB-like acyl-CoA dehydrogenase